MDPWFLPKRHKHVAFIEVGIFEPIEASIQPTTLSTPTEVAVMFLWPDNHTSCLPLPIIVMSLSS